MSGHAFFLPIQKFRTADGKEFERKEDAEKYIENEIQEYMNEILKKQLKKENIEIRFSALCAIVRAFAEDIKTIDKFHNDITNILYGKIPLPIQEEEGEVKE